MEDATESTSILGGMFAIHEVSYFIAIFDIIQSLYLMVQSTSSLVSEVNLISILSCVGSAFWVLMSVLLLVGLWRNRHRLIACWLTFSVMGIIADISFFVWTIVTSEYVKFNDILHFTILYVGIVVEWFCVYIIYKYYIKTARIADQPEENSAEYEFEHPSDRHQMLRSKDPEQSEPVQVTEPPNDSKHGGGKSHKVRDSFMQAKYRRL